MNDAYFSPLGSPTIYAYTTQQYAETPWLGEKQGKGLLKVGYTKGDVEDRIWQQFPVKMPDEQPFKILVKESALANDGAFFTDRKIHQILKMKGFRNVNGEWFECAPADVLNAIV